LSPKFVTVVFPLALPKLYTYSVPDALAEDMQIGKRVEVSLKNKLYSALVFELIAEDIKLEYKPKPIISILDATPMVTVGQLQFWVWMAEYYCCTIGEVMNVAMPSGLKLESETRVVFNGDLSLLDAMELSDEEYLVAEAVSIQNELTILQIQDILDKKTIFPVLRSLLDKRVISVKEELIEKFKPKMVNFMTLCEPYLSEPQQLTEAFDLVSKSEKQTKLLLAFVQMSRNKQFSFPVSEVCDLAGVDTSFAAALAKKGLFSIQKQTISRINKDEDVQYFDLQPLSAQQIEALENIQKYFDQHMPVLLHGITGSGKTRVYSELIKNNLDSGKQILYLLPEIALTTHMVQRLKTVFGNEVLVYHSRMNNQERVEIWNAVLLGSKLIVGARSSLFLPFVDLGLIIVDEEHDPSYKQNDPSPRYNARDAAIFLSKHYKAPILLGSATPSLESYANTVSGKYGIVEMAERHGAAVLPHIEIVDLKPEHKDKSFKGTFSKALIQGIEEALAQKEQVILFQNRRGYAPTMTCMACGWNADCVNCDVHMTIHKSFHELRCHYCGSRSKLPERCPACGNHELIESGFGTERIEEELKTIFPTALVTRMDFDTAKTKIAFEGIIHDFENGQIDILIGTQMVTKGLDFDNISLVGVLNADNILRYPDLRANERAFQLLTQVSGRAGRRDKKGKVIIQTYNPSHPVIIETMHHMYDRFFERESGERKMFRYPPYFRMIQIELLHKNSATVNHTAAVYAQNVEKLIGNRLIGPAIPSIARVRGQYINTITIKMEKDPKIVRKVKDILLAERDKLKTIPACKSVRINIDVDPY
jgi:primosomal protein N' (replication factor Y) (superfamily II helicase)